MVVMLRDRKPLLGAESLHPKEPVRSLIDFSLNQQIFSKGKYIDFFSVSPRNLKAVVLHKELSGTLMASAY